MMRNYWLYVLKLEQGKYYIGVTSQTPEKRFHEHLKGIRSAYWTQKYRPVEILAQQDLGIMTYEDAEVHENKLVRKWMDEKGYNNVRGGDLTDMDPYIRRFGWYLDSFGWETALIYFFLIIVILMLVILYYTK